MWLLLLNILLILYRLSYSSCIQSFIHISLSTDLPSILIIIIIKITLHLIILFSLGIISFSIICICLRPWSLGSTSIIILRALFTILKVLASGRVKSNIVWQLWNITRSLGLHCFLVNTLLNYIIIIGLLIYNIDND